MTFIAALGLRTRIALALLVALALFIVLTEAAVAQLVQVAMTRQSALLKGGAITDEMNASLQQDIASVRRLIRFYLVIGAALALVLGSLAVTRLVVRPLAQVAGAVERVAEGKLNTQMPIEGAKELIRLGLAFNKMTTTLRDQKEELTRRLAQLERSSGELKEVQDRLIRAAKLASVGTLAAGVAHEIGNPLAGVLGLLDALDNEEDRQQATGYRELMRKEIRRIDRTIQELLLYARPNPSAESDQRASIGEVLEHVRALLSAQQLFDRIEFDVDMEDQLDQVAIAGDDLTQVMINLFLNSAQAMEGNGRISVRAKKISGWRPAFGAVLREAVRLTVRDNGPGISAEQAKTIFDPFFTTKSPTGGSGLGLAICHSICDRSGGEIALDPEFADGSSFEVTLPIAPVQSKA